MVCMTFLSSENKTQKCVFLIFFGNCLYNLKEGVVVALCILYKNKNPMRTMQKIITDYYNISFNCCEIVAIEIEHSFEQSTFEISIEKN